MIGMLRRAWGGIPAAVSEGVPEEVLEKVPGGGYLNFTRKARRRKVTQRQCNFWVPVPPLGEAN